MRVKVLTVKGCQSTAAHVEGRLRVQPGVTSVRASALTGSVLVHFDPAVTDHHRLLAAVEDSGYALDTTGETCRQADETAASLLQLATKVMLKSLSPMVL